MKIRDLKDNSSSLGGHPLKKKYIVWGAGIAILLAIMIILDIQKVKKEEKPPLPTITIGDQTFQPVFEDYSWWNGQKMSANEISNPNRTTVEPFHDLVVNFSEVEKPDHIKIQLTNPQHYYTQYVETDVASNTIKLPNHPSVFNFLVEAKWEDKGSANYRVEIEIEEKWSYQRWLSPNPHGYGILIIDSEQQGHSSNFPPHFSQKINMMATVGGQSLEQVQRDFPELDIQTLPTFVVLDYDSVIMKTENEQELVAYLTNLFGSAYQNLLPSEEGTLATMFIVPEIEDLHKIFERLSSFPQLRATYGIIDGDGLEEYYPELDMSSIPVFFIFDHQGTLFQTQDEEEFFEFIEEYY